MSDSQQRQEKEQWILSLWDTVFHTLCSVVYYTVWKKQIVGHLGIPRTEKCV